MIWITFGWSSGWGQVKSGQTRSNFEVSLLFKRNWRLSDLIFDGEFNGGIFIFLDGLELSKIAIKIFVICSFRGLFGNFETKNWRIASKFGMGIANTELHNICVSARPPREGNNVSWDHKKKYVSVTQFSPMAERCSFLRSCKFVAGMTCKCLILGTGYGRWPLCVVLWIVAFSVFGNSKKIVFY